MNNNGIEPSDIQEIPSQNLNKMTSPNEIPAQSKDLSPYFLSKLILNPDNFFKSFWDLFIFLLILGSSIIVIF